jgi:hypothetical protein
VAGAAGERGVTRRVATLFLALLLGMLSVRTGLPRRELHHPDDQGFMHCCCGCDCDQHPDSPDSCLNPLNHHITCGCAQEHQEEWRPPLPRLSVFLPGPGLLLAAGLPVTRLTRDEPCAGPRAGIPPPLPPPH